MKKNILRSGVIALLSVVFLVSSSASVLAASSTTTATNNDANTLKISPLRTDITVPKGSSTIVKVIVSNLTSAPISLQPIENDFIAGPNENGEPAIILNPSQYAPTHSLKRFMMPLPASITVPANGATEVELTIAVPVTAQAGGYFGAVRFAPTGSAGSKSVNLSASVASLILMTVPGPTVESLDMTNFDIQQDGSTGSDFRTPNNIDLFLRFQNQGNLQEAPFGQIYVQKGKKVLYSYNFNQSSPKQEILPDSARRWTMPLSGFGRFGEYTVGATFTYGVNKAQSIDVTKTVWIIPRSLIFGAIGAVVLLIVLIFVIRLLLKSYKRRILRNNRRR